MAIGQLAAGIEGQGLSGCHFPLQAIMSFGRRAQGIASGSSQAAVSFSQISRFLELAWAKHFCVCLPLKDCPIAVREAAALQSLPPLSAPVGSFLSLGSRVTFCRTFWSFIDYDSVFSLPHPPDLGCYLACSCFTLKRMMVPMPTLWYLFLHSVLYRIPTGGSPCRRRRNHGPCC